jgi:cargo-transport protein YPP1
MGLLAHIHCVLGFSFEKIGATGEALNGFASMMPSLSTLPVLSVASSSVEFRHWTERLLTRFIAASMNTHPLDDSTDFDKLLQVFHLWTSLFRFYPTDQKPSNSQDSSLSSPEMPELGLEVEYSRWDMWMAYYSTLSEILKHGFIYATSYTDSNPKILRSLDSVSEEQILAARLKQRTELKNVETKIEAKLLEEASFPRANGRNGRVERWVDAVMENWKVMCGRTWQDADLGQGGKNAIARGVLDVSTSTI